MPIYNHAAIQHDQELMADNCCMSVSSFANVEIVQFGTATRGIQPKAFIFILNLAVDIFICVMPTNYCSPLLNI